MTEALRGPSPSSEQPAARPSGLAAPLSARVWAAAAALVGLHVLLAWHLRQMLVATGNDDAQYLLLARALRAGTYRDLHLLGQPWHAQYPPGYPLLLALSGGELGPRITGPVVLGIVLSAVTLILLFDLARRHLPPAFALALLAMMALSPHLVASAGAVRSETPFIWATVVALWCLLVWPERRGAVIAGSAAAILAALTRTIGIALVGAVVVHWAWERRWQRLAIFLLFALPTAGAWLAWTFLAPQPFLARSYAAMLTFGAATHATPLDLLLRRLVSAIKSYILDGSLGSALGFPRIPDTSVENMAGVVGALSLAFVGAVASRRWSALLSLYLLASVALLVAWTYKLTRFLVPLTPLVLLLAVVGAAAVSGQWGRRPRAFLLGGLTLFFLAGGLQGFVRAQVEVNRCTPDDVAGMSACLSAGQRAFFEATHFLRDSVPPATLVVSAKDAVLGLYTGRPELHGEALRLRFGTPFLPGLRARGDVIIVLSEIHRWHLPEELVAQCDQFEVVRSYTPLTDLIRPRPAGANGLPNACETVARHARLRGE